MVIASFNSLRDLQAYIDDNSILPNAVVQIVWGENRWVIFHS
jgi:hypothetical protein